MSDMRYGETVTLLVPYGDPRTLALADEHIAGFCSHGPSRDEDAAGDRLLGGVRQRERRILYAQP